MSLPDDNLNGLNVLLVEDEEDAAEIIDALLNHYHVTARHVYTAEDAYQALMTTPFDAAIVDLFLPGMDGLELIRRIRENPNLASLPSIAVTAYNSTTVKKQAFDAGYDRYFAKPLDPAELARSLHEILA